MKKIMKINILKSFFFGFIILTIFHNSAVFANSMVAFKENSEYVGFTEDAKILIKNSRKILLKRKEIFSKKFRQFETIYHAAHLMRLIKGNMFLYGPPGGAKSYFLNWLLEQEKEEPFKIQMHQMMTEQVFVGGQDYETAKLGFYKVNTAGSLAAHKTAVIDEIDKGNPSALAALLSLLNERVVYLGSTTYKSPMETIFSTSNKNLYEFHEEFEKNGQGSTADALLNRFSSIVFVPNWLNKEDQLALDKEHLAALENDFNQNKNNGGKESLELDWDGLRTLAHELFVPSAEFYLLERELVNKLRTQSIELIERSADRGGMNELPYYPTVQYTERLRQKIIEVILMSLTLDFLTSPLSEDLGRLENTLKTTEKHRFILTPLSLWRAYPILTTISYGVTKLEIIGNGDHVATINFGDFLDNYQGENKRVNQMISDIKEERNIFKTVLEGIWHDHQEEVVKATSSAAMFQCSDDKGNILTDIERILLVK